MDMYKNLKPIRLDAEVTIAMPVLAWATIASWYAAIEGMCPEMNWLTSLITEAVLTPSAFKAITAAHAEQQTLPGLLRRMGIELSGTGEIISED